MASLAEASVKIRPDTRGFGGELSKQVDKDALEAGKKAGKHVGTGVGVGLGSALAAAGIASLLKESVDEAVTFVESASKVKQIFKENAEAIQHFAHEAADGMGQSTTQAQDAASKFGIFGLAANLSGEELVHFSERLTTLASDLASFNNTSPEDAINAIGSALAGQARPMRTYGVLLDQANIQAQALGMGLVHATGNVDEIGLAQSRATLAASKYIHELHKHGPASLLTRQAMIAQTAAQLRLTKAVGGHIPALTQEQRILATEALIMEQTKVQQGDFTRTKMQAANQSRILTAETENLKEAIGLGLLPILIKGQRIVLDVIHAYQEHAATLGTATVVVLGFVVTLWAINAAMGVWETLTIIAEGLHLKEIGLWIKKTAVLAAHSIANLWATATTWLLVAGVTALDTALAILTSPITLIIAGIALLVVGIIYAYKHSEKFRTIVQAVWKAIKIAAAATVDWFVNTAWPFLQRVWSGIAAGATWLYRNILHPVFTAMMFYAKLVGTVLYDVFKLIAWVITEIVVPAVLWMWHHVWGPILRQLGGRIMWLWHEVISPAFHFIALLATWLWHDKIVPAFQGIGAVAKWLWTHGIKPAWDSIIDKTKGVWAVISWIFGKMLSFIKNTLVPGWKDGMKGVGDAWDLLKDLAKKPVNFVIGTVMNKGIIDTINRMTGWFGKSADLKHLPTLERGGVVPGRPSRVDNTLAHVASGEYVMPTERTRQYYPLLEAMRRGDLASYADGGLIGALTNPVGFIRSKIGSVTSHFGNNVFVRGLASAVESVVGRVADWLKSKLGFVGDSVGGGAGLGAIPNLGGPGGGSSIRAILAMAQRFYPGAAISSGYRPGDPGLHGSGQAADIVGGGPAGMAMIARGFYAISSRLLELIHSPSWFVKMGQRVGADYYRSVFAEHFNHVHVAANASALSFDRGGVLNPGWNTVWNGTGGRETLVPPGGGPLVEAGAITLHVHGDLTPGVLPQVRQMLDDTLRSVVIEVRKGVRR